MSLAGELHKVSGQDAPGEPFFSAVKQIRKPERPGNESAGLVSNCAGQDTGCKDLDDPDSLP